MAKSGKMNIISLKKRPGLAFDSIKRIKVGMFMWLLMPTMIFCLVALQILTGLNLVNLGNTLNSAQASNEDKTSTNLPPLPDYEWKNTGLVTLWFDDGWRSQYETGFSVLEQHKFKGALAVPTRAIGTFGYMDWLQVKKMQFEGWEINAHSRTHRCDSATFSQVQVDFEVIGSRQDLKEKGLRNDIYVTPCGVETTILKETILKNYPGGLRSSNGGFNPIPVPDRYDMKVQVVTNTTTRQDVEGWLKESEKNKTWLIILFHRLDDKTDIYDTDQNTFADLIQAVADSKLPVVLPSQVLNIRADAPKSIFSFFSRPAPSPTPFAPVNSPPQSQQDNETVPQSNSNDSGGNETSEDEEPIPTDPPEPDESPEPEDSPQPTPEPSPSDEPEPEETPSPEPSEPPDIEDIIPDMLGVG